MNKNNIVTKRLFHIQIDGGGGEINIFCIYNIKTNHVGIRTDRKKYFKHKKISFKHVKQGMAVCKILQQDAMDLKNDPHRLSTSFKQKIIKG